MENPVRGFEFYHSIPKVELHRHLEGSLRLSTMSDIARSHGLDLPGTSQLRPLVEVQREEPNTFQNFLSKFDTLRLFYRSPEIIARVAYEAIADAARDNVSYIELRFTPVALSRLQGFSLGEVIDWVIEGVERAKKEFGIRVGLIISANRHESPLLAETMLRLAVEHRSEGVVGVDLCGNEAKFSGLPFASLFQDARKEGMHVTIHAGEWGGSRNIAEAIEYLGAERIGHGIRVLDDPYVTSLARERGIPFEVCITSNCHSGAVAGLDAHPLAKMLAAGLIVTLNTDDPSISGITLSNEFRVASEGLGFSDESLHEMVLAGAKAAFLPSDERQKLLQQLAGQKASGV